MIITYLSKKFGNSKKNLGFQIYSDEATSSKGYPRSESSGGAGLLEPIEEEEEEEEEEGGGARVGGR